MRVFRTGLKIAIIFFLNIPYAAFPIPNLPYFLGKIIKVSSKVSTKEKSNKQLGTFLNIVEFACIRR